VADAAPKMPSLAADETLWEAKDVATYLKMSISWVRKRTARGEIPFLRIGGSAIRYEPDKIKTWARTGCGGKVVDFKR
jgi:hypothetical protein